MNSIFSKFGIFLVFFLSFNQAYCQEEQIESPPKAKSSSYNNELGINAAVFSSAMGGNNSWYYYYYDLYDYSYYYYYPFFLGDYNQSTLSFKHYFDRVSIGVALGGNFSSNKQTDNDGDIYKVSYSMFNVRLGLEKQTAFGGRWQMYYGLGIATSQYISSVDYDDLNIGDFDYKIKYTTIDAGPVLGFRFRFGERFSVSADASIKATYQKSQYVSSGSGAGFSNSTGFNMNISPIRGLYFNYYF